MHRARQPVLQCQLTQPRQYCRRAVVRCVRGDLALHAPVMAAVHRFDQRRRAIEEHPPECRIDGVVALADVQRVDVRATLRQPQPQTCRRHRVAIAEHVANGSTNVVQPLRIASRQPSVVITARSSPVIA